MKIFGIGLSRTGTQSLTGALRTLGYRAKHFPRIEHEILAGDYRLESHRDFDALTDTPVAPIFAQLDLAHPGSKFILTTRNLDDWLTACARFFPWQDEGLHGTPFERVVLFHRLYTYGCCRFHRDRWAYVFETHARNVALHFRERPGDFLTLNIVAGDGWQKLCAFLHVDRPNAPFPWENSLPHVSAAVSESGMHCTVASVSSASDGVNA